MDDLQCATRSQGRCRVSEGGCTGGREGKEADPLVLSVRIFGGWRDRTWPVQEVVEGKCSLTLRCKDPTGWLDHSYYGSQLPNEISVCAVAAGCGLTAGARTGLGNRDEELKWSWGITVARALSRAVPKLFKNLGHPFFSRMSIELADAPGLFCFPSNRIDTAGHHRQRSAMIDPCASSKSKSWLT